MSYTESEPLKYSKKSWHYRLIHYTWGKYQYYPVPTNLCPYIRKLILSMICGPMFFVWRHLPNVIQRHDQLALALFVYGLAVHATMIIITVGVGGMMHVGTEVVTMQNTYQCDIPNDLTSCVPIGDHRTLETITEMYFSGDGTRLVVESTESIKQYIQIEWWWGWAFYILSVLAASGLFGVAVGIMAVIDAINHRKRDYTKRRTTNIVKNYIESKHDKVCPCIVFTDE